MSSPRTVPESTKPQAAPAPQECKHPRVRVVSREEDTEFVECELCGDVFDSSEFDDMAIEDKLPAEDDV
jgi:hypothetical protein